MDRLACVDLPALPLQLLLRDHPDWQGYPAAVVQRDQPQAPLTWVNELARAAGILPGMRYAAGLSLARELRAGVVSEEVVAQAVTELTEHLRLFTPDVEPSTEEPGVFWLDAAGLGQLYPSLEAWAGELRAGLEQLGYSAALSVGFSRFGSYAAVKGWPERGVLEAPAQEHELSRGVPLARLDIDPKFRDALHKLGIRTLGGLIDLPPAGIKERFGPAAYRMHRLAAGDLWAPLQPVPAPVPTANGLLLEDPVHDVTQLLFHLKRQLHPLLATLSKRGESLTALNLHLVHERGPDYLDSIRPAAPTLDEAELLLLLRLRLEALEFHAGVMELHLTTAAVPTVASQDQLLRDAGGRPTGSGRSQGGPPRDLRAAARALAFVKAEFGPGSVVRARLREGHLPEASFTFEPLTALPPAQPRDGPPTAARPLVRRLHLRPTRMREPPRAPRGWLLRNLGLGRILSLVGPHVIRGGWWARELHREYHFATTDRGYLLWLYCDRLRKRWVIQGRVE